MDRGNLHMNWSNPFKGYGNLHKDRANLCRRWGGY